MDEREDSKILRRRDEEHVSIFKARAGMGAVIMEGQEIGAVVRYIEALEQKAARRTTPDREAIIEECAKVCDDRIMGDQSEGDFEAKRCAEAIRALKTASTTSLRDTLIEEIAEMVDHMGEGRRLEEYVGAIREMKGGNR
ncbi:hypothetical protein [Burkholderia vietnamiensis]|uniref:hypothetical protein n=1 Tax=Burkholderia vietnamiensis TaxID=60552 RepID=UPI001B916209|nr:hypothetical protein [Burkholderia vietnamiensis]MBR7998311.1 hypothetical protein [Burkholderia vietnamiensis]